MQAKYKLLANHSPLLGNDASSKPVPGYDPGHTLGTGEQEPHTLLTLSTTEVQDLKEQAQNHLDDLDQMQNIITQICFDLDYPPDAPTTASNSNADLISALCCNVLICDGFDDH
ncbi:hypothetical protein DSO57_1031271 [Entomophthora muscae]|uniref:Uncharacterized protein n=1 Tax=Entomophthora muscae TaxID=34485 RepID=A0ACC2UMD4_9FUNG|nr:hypothetical protein DSO57_1031271 [Entomophthora muscae]